MKEIIKKIQKHCESYNFKVIIKPKEKLIVNNFAVSGYFDPKSKEIAFTIDFNDPKSYLIAIHEYCHFLQYIENTKEFLKTIEHSIHIENFINNKPYNQKTIKNSFLNIMKLELDCEKRVIDFCLKNNIHINKKEYIQKSNSYVNYYKEMYYTKKWYNIKTPPFEDPSIYSKMPTFFDFNLLNPLTF